MNSKNINPHKYTAWTILFYGSVISIASAIIMVPASFISVAYFDSSLLLGGIISVIASIAFLASFILYESNAFPSNEISNVVIEVPQDPHENDIYYPRAPRLFL